MNRREFVQTASFAAAAALAIPTFLRAAAEKKAIGLQLYSLRDVIMKDPKGVLKQVASFGYKELETFAYNKSMIYGMPFKEFGAYCKSLGMQVMSGHYGIDIIRNDWERAVADAKEIGQEYVVCPWLAEPERSPEAIKKVCEDLNKAGEVANKYGLRMGYHNHDFEFAQYNDQPIYDMMLKELDPKLVGMEMDIFWVVYAGYDPLKYFEKYPGRFEQWHIKDMSKEDRKKNADIGTGIIDFKNIFAKASQSGMKHFYIEQETYTHPSIECVQVGADYLKGIL